MFPWENCVCHLLTSLFHLQYGNEVRVVLVDDNSWEDVDKRPNMTITKSVA